ncbi:MAG: cell filamentation protein Fic, partial [Bacteroidetes bacterium]|nr:cell filamentation protein Fic [Bacteroidota bacterium]
VGGEKRTVEQEVIEERLLSILNTEGEKALNQLRDRAREIARELDMEKAFDKLNLIIGSMLATRPSGFLTSPQAAAQAIGEPYDADRLELFSVLLAQLKQTSFPERQEKTKPQKAFSNFAFFEAYFSNYIEGTTFLVKEAREIIYDEVDIPLRIQDSHDIRGTYQIVSDRREMSITPNTGKELISLLRERHAIVLGGRSEKNPGAFKTRQNRAGSSVFVAPKFVLGTLKQGFALMASLENPISRAIYMMFLISEVHPFVDGNGRVARIMMNAELVHGEKSKIIIPTVYREDYILTLRKLTRQRDPKAFVRMMERASAFSHWLEPRNWDIMDEQLRNANAYKDPDQDGTILRWE